MLLFYTLATIFEIYRGSDMMFEMRVESPRLQLYLLQRIGMVLEELVFNDVIAKWIASQLNDMAVTGFVPLSPSSPAQSIMQLTYLTTPYLIF